MNLLKRLFGKRRKVVLCHKCRNVVLTQREKEVMELVVEGDSNLEIAEKLGVSASTVKNHVSVAMQKLYAKNRTHAAKLYQEGK